MGGLVEGSRFSRFRAGASLPIRGARMMVTTPALWPWIAIPVFVTTVLVVGAAGATWSWGGVLVESWWDRPDAGGTLGTISRGVWTLADALSHLVVFLVLAVASWFLGLILASPFYDAMSAKVEEIVLDRPRQDDGWAEVLGDILLGIRHTIAGLTLWVGLWLPILFIGLVPVFGQIAAAIAGPLLTAFTLSREVMDYSLSRRRYSFRTKIGILRELGPTAAGLGVATLVISSIPLLNFISMPAAIVGGTLLYCELEQSDRLPPDRS